MEQEVFHNAIATLLQIFLLATMNACEWYVLQLCIFCEHTSYASGCSLQFTGFLLDDVCFQKAMLRQQLPILAVTRSCAKHHCCLFWAMRQSRTIFASQWLFLAVVSIC